MSPKARALVAGFGLMIALVPTAARGAPQGVELLPSGATLIHFVVHVPTAGLESVSGVPDAPEARRIAIEGFDSVAPAGEPALPQRIVYVAVPPEGEVRVRAQGLASRSFDGVVVAPQPAIDRAAPGVPRYPRAPRPEAARGVVPGSRARLLDVSWMRNQRVALIAVTPAEYDARAARVTVSTEVDVEVEVSLSGPRGSPAEANDPFERVYRDLLVNYEQGRDWRRTGARRGAIRSLPEAGASVAAETSSVFVGHNWVKIAVSQTGFYSVNYGQIRNLAPFAGAGPIPADSLRLFAWPGSPVLNPRDYCDDCDFQEVAIGVVDGGDTLINTNSDSFYFFALGPSDWADLYDPTRPDTVFVNNPYETRSFYYLTVSTEANPVPGPRRRIATTSGQITGGAATPATFDARVHVEQDLAAAYLPDLPPGVSSYFWEKWFWRTFQSGDAFVTQVDLPGLAPAPAARLRMRLWGMNDGVYCDDPSLNGEHTSDVEINGTFAGEFRWHGTNGYTVDTPAIGLVAGTNDVRLSIANVAACPEPIDKAALAWFDIFYPRRFEPLDDELTFDSPLGSGDYLYQIGPFVRTVAPRVFDVTRPDAPQEVTDIHWVPGTGGHQLSFQLQQQARRRIRLVRDSSFVTPPQTSVLAAPATSLVNLRSAANRADYLVIFYDEFAAAAESLAAWRQAYNGYTTMTVPISALYDQFSGGRTDPAAIRNFLRNAFLTWDSAPTFVTLLGDASFDFKNQLGRATGGRPGSLLPTYEDNFDAAVAQQYATDDWMLNVDNALVVVPDFFGGRLPAPDAATAIEMVRDKVLRYERAAPLGEYRNRIMLIADDAQQASVDDGLHWAHVAQTTRLDTLRTPPQMDRTYIYLHKFRDESGHTKPTANQAISDAINDDGVLLFNYVGHGGPTQLADERVFIDNDARSLRNGARLPLFVAASCDIGRYDDPRVQCLGEQLLVRAEGGAIGVISATGEAFSTQNASLNELIYAKLFARDGSGLYYVPISEALTSGKSGSTNSQKYQLLGDAATRLLLPHFWVDVTLRDSAGTNPVAALQQGRTLTVNGDVRTGPGSGTHVNLEGVAALLIEDAQPLEKTPDCPLAPGCGGYCSADMPPDCRPFYYSSAGPVYRGDLELKAGRFAGRFVVPIDARLGARGRLRSYVTGRVNGAGSEIDGAGSDSLAVLSGGASSSDHSGPQITLEFAGGSKSVRPDATLRVLLHDPSGILTTAHTPQNGIVVTLDDNSTDRTDVTPSFRYAADSYQAGTATYTLPGVSSGPHRIRVSAADNLAAGLNAGQHRSSATIDFEVSDSPPLRISTAYLFPNPIRSGGSRGGGQFVVDVPGDSVNVLIRVYTVTGRMIRLLRAYGGEGQVQIAWDGRDEEGESLANGTYVFRVHVNGREADGSSSATRKATADGRFVVIGR